MGDGSLLLVGCGKMGGALLSGWLSRDDRAAAIHVVEPSGSVPAGAGVHVYPDPSALPSNLAPDLVMFAVKPQVMDDVTPPYARFANPGTVFLSIAAGKTIGYFERILGSGAAIVRAMPNTPSAVGRGMTVLCANSAVTQSQKTLSQDLLQAVGGVDWVEDEGLIDAVTAVSGGGPAYVFLLIEVLAEAGVAAGLPAELSARLARATVEGSGELSRLSPEPPSQLRKNVTSPGGTTKAALDVLMAHDGIGPVFKRAIAAATNRSRELA